MSSYEKDRKAVRLARGFLWFAVVTSAFKLLVDDHERQPELASLRSTGRMVSAGLNLVLLLWSYRHPRTGHAAAFWLTVVGAPLALAILGLSDIPLPRGALVVAAVIVIPAAGLIGWMHARAWNAATRIEEYHLRLQDHYEAYPNQ